MPFDPNFWADVLGEISSGISTWLPNLAGALILLILGWVVARLAQFALAGLLRRLGLDRLAERAGASQLLAESGLDPSVASLIARLVYWLVLLVFVLAAAESLGLQGLVNTLGGLVAYLPSVLAAALILLLGGLIARVIGDGLGALASQAGLPTGHALGQVVRYVLLVFVIILAIQQLGVQATLLVSTVTALIAATALALALAFGLGSRDLARNIMAGFHAKEQFSAGQSLRVRGHTGRLVSIGPVKALLETDAGMVSVPNSVLIEEEVTILAEDGGGD